MTSTRERCYEVTEEGRAHPLVQAVMEELRWNLNVPEDGLAAYGIAKVAHVAGAVAAAVALGLDPEELRITPQEYSEVVGTLAQSGGEFILVEAPGE